MAPAPNEEYKSIEAEGVCAFTGLVKISAAPKITKLKNLFNLFPFMEKIQKKEAQFKWAPLQILDFNYATIVQISLLHLG